MSFININGKMVTAGDGTVPVDNGAFRYGYGIFETMLLQDGIIRLKEYHWERLFSGLAQLQFQLPALIIRERLEKEITQLATRNKLEQLCRVRLQFFAGAGGLYSGEVQKPGYVIECFPLGEDILKLNENGLVTGVAEGVAKSADRLSNLKSCNALVYAMAARQAKAQHWNDALILNTSGNIIESTIANIFWIKDGAVFTPPLTEGCVAGVMRRHIMNNVQVKEQPLNEKVILHADEVFLTNAIKRMRWVNTVGDRNYGNSMIRSIYHMLYNK